MIAVLLPILAMAGVGALLVLPRFCAQGTRLTATTRAVIFTLVAAVFGACCIAAVDAAFQIARIGLAGTPAPGVLGTVGRLVGVAFAIALWPSSRRYAERAFLFAFVVGAGASALTGLGMRSGILDAARIVYHLFMFACGAIMAATVDRRFTDRTMKSSNWVTR